MIVLWSPEAEQDRQDIWDHIVVDHPKAAVRLDTLFRDAATVLEFYPQIGKPGMIVGTRELLPHEHYRLVYEINGDTIWILALVHIARLWPPAR